MLNIYDVYNIGMGFVINVNVFTILRSHTNPTKFFSNTSLPVSIIRNLSRYTIVQLTRVAIIPKVYTAGSWTIYVSLNWFAGCRAISKSEQLLYLYTFFKNDSFV